MFLFWWECVGSRIVSIKWVLERVIPASCVFDYVLAVSVKSIFQVLPDCTLPASVLSHPWSPCCFCSPSAPGLFRKKCSQETTRRPLSALGWARPRSQRTAGQALTTLPHGIPAPGSVPAGSPKHQHVLNRDEHCFKKENCGILNILFTSLRQCNLSRKTVEREAQLCAITCY